MNTVEIDDVVLEGNADIAFQQNFADFASLDHGFAAQSDGAAALQELEVSSKPEVID